MPTPTRGPRLGGSPAHQRLILSNLATSLFEHGRITTTEAKAKRLRPLAERLITFAKRGDLHARRQVLAVVRDKTVVHTLFAEIGPRFAQRPGGYTRITKLGPRKGDNAPMAVIELVEGMTIAQEAVGEAERARSSRFARRRGGAGVTGTAAAGGSAAVDPTAAVTIEGDGGAGSEQAPSDLSAPAAVGDEAGASEAPGEVESAGATQSAEAAESDEASQSAGGAESADPAGSEAPASAQLPAEGAPAGSEPVESLGNVSSEDPAEGPRDDEQRG